MSTLYEKTGSNRLPLFLFRAADRTFALKAADVQEVVHMVELITPPGRPSFLAGFIHMDGCAVPVVDLSILMGFSGQTIGVYTPLVVVKGEPAPEAIIVDRVLEIEPVDTRRIVPLDDATVFNQCVAHTGKTGRGDTFYLLSPHQVLLARERQRMNEFQEVAQRRLNALEAGTGTP